MRAALIRKQLRAGAARLWGQGQPPKASLDTAACRELKLAARSEDPYGELARTLALQSSDMPS